MATSERFSWKRIDNKQFAFIFSAGNIPFSYLYSVILIRIPTPLLPWLVLSSAAFGTPNSDPTLASASASTTNSEADYGASTLPTSGPTMLVVPYFGFSEVIIYDERIGRQSNFGLNSYCQFSDICTVPISPNPNLLFLSFPISIHSRKSTSYLWPWHQ